MAKSDGVEIVKYDRDILTRTEVQPVAVQDGHTIVVGRTGYFAAKVGSVEISEPTLVKAKEKVHATHLALKRKAAKRTMAVPAFVIDRAGKYAGPGFFRGFHAGNGDILYSKPDGSKHGHARVVLFHPDDPSCEEARRIAEEWFEVQQRADALELQVRKIVKVQEQKMFEKGGWSLRPRIRNDAEAAQDAADELVARVLKPEPS